MVAMPDVLKCQFVEANNIHRKPLMLVRSFGKLWLIMCVYVNMKLLLVNRNVFILVHAFRACRVSVHFMTVPLQNSGPTHLDPVRKNWSFGNSFRVSAAQFVHPTMNLKTPNAHCC